MPLKAAFLVLFHAPNVNQSRQSIFSNYFIQNFEITGNTFLLAFVCY